MRHTWLTALFVMLLGVAPAQLPPTQSAPFPLNPRPKPLTGAPSTADVKATQKAWAKYLGVPVERKVKLKDDVYLELVLIPPGTFWMGSPRGEKGRDNDEVQHEVELTEPFYLGKHEVTQEQYQAGTGKNPSEFKGAKLPVEMVSWDDADTYTRKLKEKLGGKPLFRLPTEAEWEYSCRGGAISKDSLPFHFEDGPNASLSAYAANFDNDNGGTKPVGSYRLNRFGLYEMHGNVFEWCADRYGDYPNRNVTNPPGPSEGYHRVLRGGSWFNNRQSCRAACRYRFGPSIRYINLGFRLALVPSQK